MATTTPSPISVVLDLLRLSVLLPGTIFEGPVFSARYALKAIVLPPHITVASPLTSARKESRDSVLLPMTALVSPCFPTKISNGWILPPTIKVAAPVTSARVIVGGLVCPSINTLSPLNAGPKATVRLPTTTLDLPGWTLMKVPDTVAATPGVRVCDPRT